MLEETTVKCTATIAWLVLAAALSQVSVLDGAREAEAAPVREDTAYLDFVRTNAVRTYKDQRVLCENYVVKKGDYVWRILRRRGHGSLAQLTHWAEVLQTLNPELKDPNRVYPGQRLVVPLGFLTEQEARDTQARPPEATTSHTVQRGETLSGILRARFQLPDTVIFNEALTRVRELNPHIADVNRIQPGQRLVLPLYGSLGDEAMAEPELPQGSVSAEPAPGAPEPEKETVASPGPTEVVIDARLPTDAIAGAPVEEEGPDTPVKTRLAPKRSPEEQRVRVLADAFADLAVALGGRCQKTGRHFLPLQREGQIVLKAQSFPLLEFPTGERIFLDINDRLPSSLEAAIKGNWHGRYGVVNVRDSDNFRSVWQALMEQLSCAEQWLDRAPLHLREPVKMAIRGDWVLVLSCDPAPERGILVVNLLNGLGERTDPALQVYLDSCGVRVVDVQLRGQLEPARIFAPGTQETFAPEHTPLHLGGATVPHAATSFLDFLGQPYERDASVPLYTGQESEITVTVKAGLYFRRQGRAYLVDFGVFSPPIHNLLRERDLEVIVLDPQWRPIEVFRAMTEHLGLNREAAYRVSVSSREPRRNIELTLPGDVIRQGDQKYLLTTGAVPASLADFLARKGVKVLSCGAR
jgi:LysM repeat protein